MGETRVDLLHLLEDLRDAYPGGLEETILTEMVANSLDSGASIIAFVADPAQTALVLVDDGMGMRRRELARYHDIAASTKVRGEGIGFAGVGIKLGLLVSEEVVTETRRGRTHIATSWALASKHRAPWRWTPAPGLVAARGTAVRLRLRTALSPLLDTGFIEATLRRHFQSLLEPGFEQVLSAHYRGPVRFAVNGATIEPHRPDASVTAPLEVRLARKRKASAAGYMIRDAHLLPEELRGVAISTFGKVIKRGWDWLGITPAVPDRVGGLIEAPGLADCLTLSKSDFIRTGPRGAIYLVYRKAIQEAVSAQLAAWGDAPDAGERARRRAARPVERDLEAVLLDLAENFPLLGALVERRPGGQRRLSGGPVSALSGGTLLPDLVVAEPAPEARVTAEGSPSETSVSDAASATLAAAVGHGPERYVPSGGTIPSAAPAPGSAGAARPQRYGLSIQFEPRPDDPELGRLVESTVWINDGHPAYRRAVMSRSEGYHIAVAVAMALAPLAVEPAKEHGFVTAFLARWGGILDRRKRLARRAR